MRGKKLVRIWLLVALSTVTPLTGCSGALTQDEGSSVKAVNTVPKDADGSIMVSKDGVHWCCKIKTSEGEKVVGDRDYARSFYRTVANVQWASETGRCGFWAQKTGGDVVLVVDGKEWTTRAPNEGLLEWSPDGTRWMAAWGDAVSGKRGDCIVMVDGQEVGRHKDIGWPEWSRDSAHYGYLVGDTETIEIYVDGQPKKKLGKNWEADFHAFQYGPNIKARMLFCKQGVVAAIAPLAAAENQEKGDPWAVLRGDEVLGSYATAVMRVGDTTMTFKEKEGQPAIAPSSLAISDDGTAVAWWARPGKEGTEWFVFVNGEKKGGNLNVAANYDRIFLSPNGKRVGFIVRYYEGEGDARKTVAASLFLEGSEGRKYDWLGGVKFSPDSQRYAYWAKKLGTKAYVYVVDGEEIGTESEDTADFCFSSDSRHFMYRAEREKSHLLILDGKEYPMPYEAVWNLHFTEKGRPCFCARASDKVLLVNGLPVPEGT